jgi:hypothetical protein
VTIKPEPWNRITELAATVETTPHTTQVFYGPTYPSPDSVFYVQYASGAAGTWSSMDWVMDPELDAMIDISQVEGRVRASSLKKVGEIVEKHPEEAVSIIRNWMYQET